MARILGRPVDDSLWTEPLRRHLIQLQGSFFEHFGDPEAFSLDDRWDEADALMVHCLLRYHEPLPEMRRKGGEARAVRKLVAAESQQEVLDLLARTRFRHDSYWIVNAVSVAVPLTKFVDFSYQLLATDPHPEFVDHLHPIVFDLYETLPDPVVTRVAERAGASRSRGAEVSAIAAIPELSSSTELRHLDASGVVVGVVDTGLDASHPALRGARHAADDDRGRHSNGGVLMIEVGPGERFVQSFEVEKSMHKVTVRLVFGLERPDPRGGPRLMVQQMLAPDLSLIVECEGNQVTVNPAQVTDLPTKNNASIGLFYDYGRRIVKECEFLVKASGRCRVEVICRELEVGREEYPWRRALCMLAAWSTDTAGRKAECPFVGGEDDWGHGTQMAGAIAGRGAGPDRAFRGVAPGAEILPVKAVANAAVGNPTDAIIKAINWLSEEGRDHVRLINISLGGDTQCRSRVPSCPVCDAVDHAVAELEKIIVVSAGNDSPKGVTCPGAAVGAITVGWATWGEPAATHPRSASDAAISKPDVIVHGEDITCPRARFSVTRLDLRAVRGVLEVSLHNGLSVDGGYASASGTSVAAAAFSGFVALLLQRDPRLTSDRLLEALRSTSTPVGNVPWGLLHASKCVRELLRFELTAIRAVPDRVPPGQRVDLEADVLNRTSSQASGLVVRWVLQDPGGRLVADCEDEINPPIGGNSATTALARLTVPRWCTPGAYRLTASLHENNTWEDDPQSVALRITERPEAHALLIELNVI